MKRGYKLRIYTKKVYLNRPMNKLCFFEVSVYDTNVLVTIVYILLTTVCDDPNKYYVTR